MISLADQPYIVTFKDGTTAEDESDILLIAFTGPENPMGCVLAARELLWVPLDKLLVTTQMANYRLIDDGETPEE